MIVPRLALLFALSAGALVGQVRYVNALPSRAAEAVDAYVRETLPDVITHVVHRSTTELWRAAVEGRFEDADLLVGVDAEVLALWSNLAESSVEVGSPPFWTGASDSYVVPWADVWGIAWRAADRGPGDVPSLVDELIDPKKTGVFLAPLPDAAPAVWGHLFFDRLRSGYLNDHIEGWMRALDARTSHYGEDVAALIDTFSAGGAEVMIAPWSAVQALRAGGKDIAWDMLGPVPAVQGLGVAVLKPSSAVLQVRDALLDQKLGAVLMQEHGIVVATGDLESVPSWMMDKLEAARHWQPLGPKMPLAQWFDMWRDTARGQGRVVEALDEWIGIALGLVFIVVIWFVYRDMKREGKSA